MLETVGIVLKTALKILANNLTTLLIGIFGCSLMSCIQIYLFLAMESTGYIKKEAEFKSSLISILFTFNHVWTLTVILYFFKVYVTSIIALSLVNRNSANAEKSSVIKNSLYALGSICFASLIVAIIDTLRRVLRSEQESYKEKKNVNILTLILMTIFAFLFDLLEFFIEFANDLTLPYIAVHGDGYVKSLEKAYEISIKQHFFAAVGHGALLFALNLCNIIPIVLCGASIAFNFTIDLKNVVLVKTIIVTTVIPLVFYFTTIAIFSASFLGLIYLVSEDSKLINSECIKEVKEVMEEMITKTDQ